VTTTSTSTAADAALATAVASDAATLAVANAAAAAVASAATAAEISVTAGTTTAPALGAVSTLMANVVNFQYNPAMIQTSIMQTLTDVSNGSISIVDPTNPFVFALESASVLTAAFMIKNEANTRKQYPYAAQTPEDLYLHMSDVDYINRFATPAAATFCFLFPLNEVLNKLVLDPITNIKQIVIPRNTYITIASNKFSMQYPIMIQQMQHGGLQVVYDATITSPLEQLTTNIIPYEIRQNVDSQYIYFEVPMTQFDIISQTDTLNSSADFSMVVNFTEQYYYTRVYVEDIKGNWKEIRTTHTDEIYDINVPTAVLKVLNNTANTVGTTAITLGGSVTITIPQIYTGTGILNSGIRIDVYETMGPLDMILWEYPMTSFTATWLAIDPADSTIFTAPLSTFSSIIPFSTYVVTGGSNATPFATLRNQVITNAIGMPSLPITNAQIQTTLNIDGYTIVKNIDNVTNRVFLATKSMPVPTDPSLITPAAATVMTLNISIDQLVAINTVIDNSSISNGSSVTITPDTVYQNVNGVITPLSNTQLSSLLTMGNAGLALNVSNNNYLYTPFHYVLDTTNNEFAVRPYYLNNPAILTQLFILTNSTTLLQVNTGTYSIYRSATGYTITVVTTSNSAYQSLANVDIQAQLSYTPHGESTKAYLLGTLMGQTANGERIFSFDLSTNFNVDVNDCIQLNTFLMFANQHVLTGAPLITDFTIIYTTTAVIGPQWVANSIDINLSNFLLPTTTKAITQEILRVQFGNSLDRLWSRSRTAVSSAMYKTWATDVPRVYESDVYATDANGSVVQFDNEGNPILNLLYSAGDPVLDSNGNPVLLHSAGDTMLDNNGNPIVASNRGLMRQIDMMLIDGVYWFATDSIAANYRTILTQNVLSWVVNDLVNIETQLLEQTNIYFYPNATLGTIRAMVDNGTVVNINASQTFNIVLSVSQVVYDDVALRVKLSTSTITTISQQLSNTTFSIDSITTALHAVYGTDVVAMQLSGLGGTNNYSVVTVMNPSENCSIKKQLVANPDNTLSVVEGVVISFVLYQIPIV